MYTHNQGSVGQWQREVLTDLLSLAGMCIRPCIHPSIQIKSAHPKLQRFEPGNLFATCHQILILLPRNSPAYAINRYTTPMATRTPMFRHVASSLYPMAAAAMSVW